MHYSTAAVVALLPTFGVATRFLSGSGNTKMISPEDLQNSGGQLGSTNLATSMLADTSSTGSALPASNQNFPEGDSPQNNGNAGNAEGVNTCGFSNFVQLKEDYGYSQASVQDCYYMIWSIANDQEWIITQEIQTIVFNGTCAFQAVVSQGQGKGLIAALGNADIIDLTTDSINQFGDDGFVGCHGGFGMYTSAAGAMPCDSPNLGTGEQVFVDWFLTTPEGLTGGGSSGGDSGDTGDSTDGTTTDGTSQPSYDQGSGNTDWIQTNQKQGGTGGGRHASGHNGGNTGGGSNAGYGGRRAFRAVKL